MPIIGLNHTYTDGSPFSASTHNSNMTAAFAATHAGGIDARRMTGFNIQRHMIMPDQAVLARTDSCLDSTSYYGNAVGEPLSQYSQSVNSSDASKSGWVAVGGSGFRWYQPYAATLGVLNWSYFMSHNAWDIHEPDWLTEIREAWAVGILPIATRCVLNGRVIASTKRVFTANAAWPACNGLGQPSDDGLFYYQSQYHKPYRRHAEHEAHSAQQFNFTRMLRPGNIFTGETNSDGTPGPGVKRGWHELIVQLYMCEESDYLQECRYAYHKYGKTLRRHRSMLSTKADFGVRSARVVTFL